MSDYSQGKIYMLTSEQTPEIYIGSTKETLEERLTKHKSDYKRWLEGKYHYVSSYEILQYEDCEIKLIQNYPCNTEQELRKKEGEYQIMMDCVNKHIAGRTCKEYHKEYYSRPEVKEHRKEYEKKRPCRKEYRKEYNQRPGIKEHQKKYREKNKEEIKKKASQKIKCICGSEIRKDNMRRHEQSKNHIQYIEEMKEKADATNLNEFFEQFKFKLTTN